MSAKVSQGPGSNTLTHGVRVEAVAEFRPEESDPDVPVFLFSYRIVISNEGDQPAHLLSRHWIIKDSENVRRDVEGPGVVGEFPKLAPGESFEYLSSCPLPTSWGTMEGSYLFEREGGERFQVKIGRFFLAPQVQPIVN